MRRRDVVVLLSGAALWPLAGRAQQSDVPVIGFLSSASASQFQHLVAAFRDGLKEAGFTDGQNVTIEYRWAEGDYRRLPALAAELTTRPIKVLVATGGSPSALAAKAATAVIPIVFTSGADPVRLGLVASLNRPGGNVTGVALISTGLGPKRLELLQELVPTPAKFAALINPDSPAAESQSRELREAARALGQPIEIQHARSEPELDAVFAALAQTRSGALIVSSDPFFVSGRKKIVSLAARYSIPTIYEWRDFVEVGGLMSYGTSLVDGYRQAGIYTGRILKGDTPADIPVVQPSRIELVINLKTARSLGLTVPSLLLSRADELVE